MVLARCDREGRGSSLEVSRDSPACLDGRALLDLTLLCCRNAFAVAGHDGMVSWTAERSRTHHSFSLPQEPTALALPAQQATGYELRAAQMAVAAEEGDTDGLAALVEEDQTMLHAVRLGSAIELELLG